MSGRSVGEARTLTRSQELLVRAWEMIPGASQT